MIRFLERVFYALSAKLRMEKARNLLMTCVRVACRRLAKSMYRMLHSDEDDGVIHIFPQSRASK